MLQFLIHMSHAAEKEINVKTPRLPSLHVNWRCYTVTVASILHHQRDVSST